MSPTSRRQIIENALAAKTAPVTASNIPEYLARHHRFDNPPVGDASNLLRAASLKDRRRVLDVVAEVLADEAKGVHGEGRAEILARHNATESMDRLVDLVDVDMAAIALQQKRGSDADRPLDPPDRRDHLRAAFDAHTHQE